MRRYRKALSKKKSKRIFKKGHRVHKRNRPVMAKRGGIRL